MLARSVLLVEDDEAVRTLAEMILHQAGYKVQPCHTSEQALAYAAITPPVLLVADVTLPGPIDGMALARRLRITQPFLPIVLMSGLFDDSPVPFKGLENAILLSKPFRREAFLAALKAGVKVPKGL